MFHDSTFTEEKYCEELTIKRKVKTEFVKMNECDEKINGRDEVKS